MHLPLFRLQCYPLWRWCHTHSFQISLFFISGIDKPLIDELTSDHRLFVTLEDGALDGGWGEKVARHLGPTAAKVLCYGARKGFVDRYDVDEYLTANRLKSPLIVEDILAALQ